ncbi:SDR family oxidoreductase [Marivibrio halodurans]|uniref:SDR family oxidoreductase n=1 Tax=Marivibrio halodurans TaxID=2039722 RepID=A0A8J7S5G8_9PROT|nr:SDR family oxidoreductase [Marivibrio halodurans]MBP5857124.1 SDR family oxidoreductase [Marivibrio halodurans]
MSEKNEGAGVSRDMGAPRCVAILGGASGIGAAVARRAAAGGAAVAILDLNGAAAEAMADELGPKARAFIVDATDEAAMAAAADAVAESGLPPVDGLVASAGIPEVATPIERYAADDFDRILTSHVRTAYVFARAFGARMAAGEGGAVVFLASVLSFRPGPVLAYGAGKGALVNLTQSLAVHWAARGVRVNAVAPGWTDTPFIRAPRPDGSRRDIEPILRQTPQGRLIRPEEIAEVIQFLLSPASSAITGVTLPADGGVMAGAGWAAYGGFPGPEG